VPDRLINGEESVMAGNISFILRNDQMTDVNVTVVDLRTNVNVLTNLPLNADESTPVTVVADSDERGAAQWFFASTDGGVNSNKRQDGIRDGDECTLG
jgi:hypothetical protein